MNGRQATYTTGSIFKHLSTLSITSAIGLFAIFLVDLVDVFFISILGEAELAAAVGFAGIALFLGASVCIGIAVSLSTVVAQALGAADDSEAKRLASNGLFYTLLWTVPTTALTLYYAPDLLALVGASGRTLELAVMYFRTVGISLPILGFAMAGSFLFALQLAANPIFTSLRHPGFSTISNVIRDVVLTIPLIYIGAGLYQAHGIFAGQALANAIVGILAFAVALWLTKRVEQGKSINISTLGTRWHHYRAIAPGVQHRGH